MRRQGRLVNHKRVERLLREHGISGHSRRAGRRTLPRADRRAAAASNQLTVLVTTLLERMRYRPGPIDGLAAKTGLDFQLR
ncbi:hypothetical protein [Streptomyces sp. NPDC056690]|uniref:hypothetical protein n=1 Tax=unclassified Streptomyces TaxID=2593676 RepID=UPI0036387AC4